MKRRGKRPVKGWKGGGDCRACIAKKDCKKGCWAHEERLAAEVKKALLMQADKNNNLFRMDGEGG